MKLGPLALPYYFVLVNAASPIAFLKFMRGEPHVVWEPLRDLPEAEPPSHQDKKVIEDRS